jgi:hypothetical protein
MLIATSVALAQAPPPPQNWFPQEIETLGQNATSRTEFTLDHSMLVMASRMGREDDSLQHVIAGVDGVSVHHFRYPRVGMYDPRLLNAVRHDFSEAGWVHVGNAHEKYGYPRATDLWIRLEHNTIRNIAVLFARDNQVNLVEVSGSISPLDLLHLAGHFGIPRIEGGVVVPAPGSVPPPRSDAGPQDAPKQPQQ